MPRKVIIDLAEILQYCTSHKIEKVRGEKPGDIQEVFNGQLGKLQIPYDAPSRKIKKAAKLLSKSAKKRKRSDKERSGKRKSSKRRRKISNKEDKIKKNPFSSMDEKEVIDAEQEYGSGRDCENNGVSEHSITQQKTDTENSSTDSGSESEKSSEGSSSTEGESNNESSRSDSDSASSKTSDSE
jgi:hypothetical protein